MSSTTHKMPHLFVAGLLVATVAACGTHQDQPAPAEAPKPAISNQAKKVSPTPAPQPHRGRPCTWALCSQ